MPSFIKAARRRPPPRPAGSEASLVGADRIAARSGAAFVWLRTRGVQQQTRHALKARVAIRTKTTVALLCARPHRRTARAAAASGRAHQPLAAGTLLSATTGGGVSATRRPAGDALVRRSAARCRSAHHAPVQQRRGVFGPSAVRDGAQHGGVGGRPVPRANGHGGGLTTVDHPVRWLRARGVSGLRVARRRARGEAARQVSVEAAAWEEEGQCRCQDKEGAAHRCDDERVDGPAQTQRKTRGSRAGET